MKNEQMKNAFTPSPEKTATLDAIADIRNAIRKVLLHGEMGDKSNKNMLEALARLNDASKNVHQNR